MHAGVGRFTRLYMAAIDPFRKVIVYPALLRSICEKWNVTFGQINARSHDRARRYPKIRSAGLTDLLSIILIL